MRKNILNVLSDYGMGAIKDDKRRVTLLFLGSTGAGPVYSLEMAKALAATNSCILQIVISKQVSNLEEWKKQFEKTNVKLNIVETYSHNKLSFALSLFEFWKVDKIVNLIRSFKPDFLYVPFLLTWDFLIYPRLYKDMSIVATLHDPHPHDESGNVLANWIHKKNIQAYKYVKKVIILNKSDIPFVKKNFCKDVFVIPHASFSYYVNHVSKENKLQNTIGFIGRIEPYKGLDLLLNAFERLESNYKLLIAGSGNIDNALKEKIAADKRIELINRYIKDEEFSELINRMDFVVLPYKRASQSGVIPLVFAHGKPVVVTNVGALKEQVPDGTGIVTEPDIKSLYKSIKELYETPEKIFMWGVNAKRYAESELTWESSALKLLSIFEK